MARINPRGTAARPLRKRMDEAGACCRLGRSGTAWCRGALKFILEPIFEADFQDGSFGYRPGRSAHEAVERVAEAIVRNKTRVLDLDLQGYYDNIRHDVLLSKVARRVSDPGMLRVLKLILKATGKRGIAQGDVIAPLLSTVYLTEVDRMLERAKEVTRYGEHTYIEYVRFADDIVILIDAYPQHDWLVGAVAKRLREELAGLHVVLNEAKAGLWTWRRGMLSDSWALTSAEPARVRANGGRTTSRA